MVNKSLKTEYRGVSFYCVLDFKQQDPNCVILERDNVFYLLPATVRDTKIILSEKPLVTAYDDKKDIYDFLMVPENQKSLIPVEMLLSGIKIPVRLNYGGLCYVTNIYIPNGDKESQSAIIYFNDRFVLLEIKIAGQSQFLTVNSTLYESESLGEIWQFLNEKKNQLYDNPLLMELPVSFTLNEIKFKGLIIPDAEGTVDCAWLRYQNIFRLIKVSLHGACLEFEGEIMSNPSFDPIAQYLEENYYLNPIHLIIDQQ